MMGTPEININYTSIIMIKVQNKKRLSTSKLPQGKNLTVKQRKTHALQGWRTGILPPLLPLGPGLKPQGAQCGLGFQSLSIS